MFRESALPHHFDFGLAAVLLGSVFSTLFAGILADWMGRKPLMIISGVAFAVSIPIIALSQGFWVLFYGRLLQGISGGWPVVLSKLKTLLETQDAGAQVPAAG